MKRTLLAIAASFIAIACSTTHSQAAPAPQPQLPIMGYNTWYQYDSQPTQASLLAQAEAMKADGLEAAGYNYIDLDDGWQHTGRCTARNAVCAGAGALTWNENTFPQGIPWLASQIHAMGFKFGIYTAIGSHTCGDSGTLPGSYGHYAQDAEQFQTWGVNLVKVDSCLGLPAGTTNTQLLGDFKSFGASITADGMYYSTGMPALLPVGTPAYTASVSGNSQFANMWRATPDENTANTARYTILGHLADDLPDVKYAELGHWNDLDMLLSGDPGHPFHWTRGQQQSQLSVWAEEASPLLISTAIDTITSGELSDLTNSAMLAIDQSGSQASTVVKSGQMEAVAKSADGGVAVLLANNGTGTETASFSLKSLGYTGTEATRFNVWTGSNVQVTILTDTLPAGNTALFVLKP